MVGILIERRDIDKLSEPTRKELLGLLLKDTAEPMQAEHYFSPEGPTDLTPQLMKKFMSGVSTRTRDGLKVFAEQNGRAKMSDIVKALELEDWRQTKGFQSGITRRVRSVSGDEDGYLLEWDESAAVYSDDEELVDGEWYLSPATTAALRIYFGIKD